MTVFLQSRFIYDQTKMHVYNWRTQEKRLQRGYITCEEEMSARNKQVKKLIIGSQSSKVGCTVVFMIEIIQLY